MHLNLSRSLGCLGIALAVGLTACSKSTTPPQMQMYDPECQSCRTNGDTCMLSINCPAGSICNDPSDPLYDSSMTSLTCVKVVCASDSDCSGGKTCSLERICQKPLCQADADCSGGQVCSAGQCMPVMMASNAATCVIVTKSGALSQGNAIPLQAVALNSNGAVMPKIAFDWSSSNTMAVALGMDGATATGGTMDGTSMITATVHGNSAVTCSGLTINNFASVPAGSARVVLVDGETGVLVDGASVTLITGAGMGGTVTQSTVGGATTFANVASASAITSVTVTKDGYQYVSVLAPGTADIFLPFPPIANNTQAGGFRGSVDISLTKRADIQLGLVGPAIPLNLLDFDLASLLGDSIPTVLDAPELGLNMKNVNLPGGVMFSLGSKHFTDDSATTNTRCQGTAPAATELGCYVARAPAGPTAAWTLAGQIKLSDISGVAGMLGQALGGGGGATSIPIGGILNAVLPLLAMDTLRHGANAGLNITEFPKVPAAGAPMGTDCTSGTNTSTQCIGDFKKYQAVGLKADSQLGILSVVSLPNLPSIGGGKYSGGAVVISAAISEGRGLVPLGLAAGLDSLNMEAGDGKIDGAAHPFGPNSSMLSDGTVGLIMSPVHGGLEGSKVALVAIALDPNSLETSGGKNLQLSGLVQFADGGVVHPTETFSKNFLAFPNGTIDSAAGTWAGTVADADVIRVELTRGSKKWLIYAPGSMGANVAFPPVQTAQNDVLGAGLSAYVQTVRTPAAYSAVFTLGSGKSLDHAVDQIEAFVIEGCSTMMGAACKIQ
jgi:hypothetical protein